ncbi:hypothetical protein Hanom_Chr05g00434221 [Helianthus anomalus]
MMNTASTSSGPPAIPLNQQNDTIVQIVSPPVPPPFPGPPKPNLPRSDLLDGNLSTRINFVCSVRSLKVPAK